MAPTVYFADKAVVFAAEKPAAARSVAVLDADSDGVSRDKVLKILETHNTLCVVSSDPDRAFAAFAQEFTRVEAAGGVVVNTLGEWLMIHRNGRWDLPKGHVEPDESGEACAVREIAEETGVCAETVRPLCETWHAYWFAKTARWELKRTRWYRLRMTACDALAPQREEGIAEALWCTPEAVAERLPGAFPTIRCVAAAMRGEPDGPDSSCRSAEP